MRKRIFAAVSLVGALAACEPETPTSLGRSLLPSRQLSAAAPVSGTWTVTGSMAVARRDHTATLLADGTVLIVGGPTTVAERYDPTVGTFSGAGTTACAHGQFATATRLLDGRVLIVGGLNAQTCAEVYDPTKGAFTQTADLNAPHAAHTATLLAGGRVLVAGGQEPPQEPPVRRTLAVAELYDPVAGVFTLTGSLNTDRELHTAALLPDGQVLIAGGDQITAPGFVRSLTSAELYDPASETFRQTGNMVESHFVLWWTQAVVLGNGKGLIIGGSLDVPPGSTSGSELFDPTTGLFTATGGLSPVQFIPSTTALPNGHILVAGGFSAVGSPAAALVQVFDPVTGTFTAVATMSQGRQQHTATLLANGQVLVAGGFGGTADLNSAELFTAEPDFIEVTIDIKPGSFPNTINLGSGGTVPVGILSSASFDATTVDPATVTLADAAVKLRGKGTLMAAPENVNADGLLDLVVHVETSALSLTEGDTEAVLTGQTLDGKRIRGSDSVRIVP